MEEEEVPSGLTLQNIWISYKIPIILGSVSVFLIVLSIIILVKFSFVTKPIEFSDSTSTQASVSATIAQTVAVDVAGAVVRSGMYHLPVGSRVDDAITAAGGLTRDADQQFLAQRFNRASKLTDGAKIYIPAEGEGASQSQSAEVAGTVVVQSNLVSVNNASQRELEALSGVGPVTAQKIISNRPYQVLEELVSKKAMSQSLFTKLKDQLTL